MSRLTAVSVMALAGLSAAPMAGCRGERSDAPPRQFFPDMDDQPKYKAQSASEFFADGRSMREPVAGTVPFGARPFDAVFMGVDFAQRASYLRADRRVFEGREPVLDAAGRPVLDESGMLREVYLQRIPIEALLGVTASDPSFSKRFDDFVHLGEKQYGVFCLPCHGGTGDGKGTVGTRWSYPLPSFHAEQYQPGGEKGQDGYLFHTILYGVPNIGETAPYPLKMPAYREKVSEYEAWAIVAHLRALQTAYSAPLDAVPQRQREEMERTRGVVPQASADGAAGKEQG